MSIQELNQDQLIELYNFWLMDLVNENKITWKTMAARLYDDIEKHKKTLYFYFDGYIFNNDDFFASAEK